jgi:predicted aldo/keto reductase-like oxidoreductase
MEQVEQNIASADVSGIGALSAEELALVDGARERYRESIIVPCTNCGYCVPCDTGVKIPQVFQLYNDGAMYADVETTSWWYKNTLTESEKASACIACGDCEEVCPQKIEISDWMKIIHDVLGEGKPYVRALDE